MEALIYKVIGIAKDTVRGNYLVNFSFVEKMLWMEKRETKKEEDRVYAMLGICGVSMSIIYGL